MTLKSLAISVLGERQSVPGTVPGGTAVGTPGGTPNQATAGIEGRNGPWLPYVMPKGVRLVGWKPKCAPVSIDICSVVLDVPKFVQAELCALDSRLNDPWTIHGGFTVPQILERLRQAGVTVEIDLKAGGQ
jgi:hypothetical protein